MSWYLAMDGQRLGPLPDEQLRALVQQGKATANTQVWREGMAQWQPAGQVAPQLFAPPQAAAPAPPAPPSPPLVPPTAAASTQASPAAVATQNPLGGITGILDDAMCSVCGRLVQANTLAEVKGGYQACPECVARIDAAERRKHKHKDLPVGQRLKLILRENKGAIILTLLMLVLMPVILWLEQQEKGSRAALPICAIASSLYIFLAISGNMHRTTPGRCMFVALILCWVGDLLRVLPIHSANQASLMVFIAAYVVLMLSFVLGGLAPVWTLAGSGVFAIMSIFVWLGLRGHVPADYALLVVFYTIAMTVFCALAVGHYGAGGTILVPIATLGLYIADVLYARDAFIEGNEVLVGVSIVLHYGALTFLGLSVHVLRAEEEDAGEVAVA